MTTTLRSGFALLVLAAVAAPPALAQPPAARPTVHLDPVAQAAPAFAGVPPAQQAEILAWMLGVDDDRRLVALFPDLAETPVPLGERGVLAREWAEALMGSLVRRGHRPPETLFEQPLAEADPAAPPPNFFPPEVMAELERAAAKGEDPAAAEALEDARRARFEGPGKGSGTVPR
jgi:hypothetical protein